MPSSLSTLGTLITLFSAFATSIPLVPRFVSPDEILAEYDYVVIGGGTSGLAVANRLSEDSSKTVLVIESGPMDDGSDSFKIPYLGRGYLNFGTKYDWNVTTVPTESLGNRTIIMPQARVLGGTSSINGMQFARGAASDYDAWEELGNEGWNFKSLDKYFKKSENFTAPSEKLAEEFGITYDKSAHGYTGYIHSSFPRFLWPLLKNWIGSLKSLGHTVSQDPASGGALQLFWSPNSLNPDMQTRSFAREYYDGAQDRANFHVLVDTTVTKLVTSRGDKVKVDAVEFSRSAGTSEKRVKVKKEAVLAAGSIFSPQILQVSGIGPASLLKSLGIEVVVDLPGVGANLQGHVYIPVIYQMANVSLAAANLTTNATFYNEMYELYKAKQDGPFTNGGPNVVAMLPLSDITPDSPETFQTPSESLSHLEPSISKGYQSQLKILLNRLRTKHMAATELLWLSEGGIIISTMHPLSRGSIKTTSPALLSKIPAISTNYLSHPLDTKIAIETLKYTRKITATAEMQELGLVEVLPGASANTNEQIEKAIKDGSGWMYHMVGTCAMMPRDLGGVVDVELRVYGTRNLRVVDASVQPLIPAAHVQATVYAIAEKAADMIKAGSLWREYYNSMP
ncbi:alcohol oxidase [Choiromyces venosus 120613-1]|uniref:Alcohol oxidase n=1 Tax=Choiromyces venosus 120613-1 TaxID=1336337 RepID=A0A3N4K7U2_9PEZI|nr:alcohol oxidase [Choiromyces venosus 120613-1]